MGGLGRLRLCGYALGLAMLAIAGAAAQEGSGGTGGTEGSRDFIMPPAPAAPAANPAPAAPAAPAAEPAPVKRKPAEPSLRTRSAKPKLQAPQQASRPSVTAKPTLAARPPARRTVLARPAPPPKPAPIAQPAPAPRPTPPVRPTLARPSVPLPPRSPIVAERQAPVPEPRAAPPDVRPAPRLAFAAGGSDGPQGELTETLKRVAESRFRLVGNVGGQRALDELLGPLGADLAVTSTVALGRAGAGPEGKARLAFVAKLFNEEVHVVAGAAVGRLADLEGKPVAIGQPGSTAESAARDLFEAAGVVPRLVAASGPEALARLRSGEIAAFVTVSGRPAAELAGIGPMENLRLIPVPFAPRLQAEYYPASLAASDYPGLIPEGERVDTLAAGTVLVAPAGPEGGDRQRRAAALVESVFRNLPELARSGHPKWREVNLGALLPDWPRFEPARRWLAAHPAPAQTPSVSSLRLDEVPR